MKNKNIVGILLVGIYKKVAIYISFPASDVLIKEMCVVAI